MNEQIHCFTTVGKMAQFEWENDESDLLPALCNVYKNWDNSSSVLVNLFKERYVSSVKSYKYLNKFIS